MQGREGLSHRPTSRYQAETGNQHGHEGQVSNVRFQWLTILIIGSTGKTAVCPTLDWSLRSDHR